ncbi:MAG: tetratricopeptide repeat protein [Spirochaetes bacterium]|nr:tetratricopeptide repeat protein [Spirochaetota bacterium]
MYEVFSGLSPSRKQRRSGAAVLLIVLLSLLALSCATALPAIPEGMSSAEIIQKAQERSDSYDWKGARYYYQALLERFPNEPDLIVTAMYELAFIEYKQGNKAQAIAGFKAVLAKYSAESGQSLPATWKILSQNLLAKLEPSPAAAPKQ